MMTLNDFENYVPCKIWARGEEYYECDAVKDLEETEPGEWIATVEGTEDYEVEISLEGKKNNSLVLRLSLRRRYMQTCGSYSISHPQQSVRTKTFFIRPGS